MLRKILMLNIIIAMSLIAMSCKNDTDKKDCGCDSDNKTYVTNQTGTLLKDSLSGSFYIYKLFPGPMYRFDIICNKDKIGNIALGSNVTYSGYRSALCDSSTFNTGQTFKDNITISQIQVNQ